MSSARLAPPANIERIGTEERAQVLLRRRAGYLRHYGE